MISIRVSPDEFHKLRAACTAEGVASVSALARLAMDLILKRYDGAMPVSDQLADLRQRIESLAADLDRLARRLEAPPGNDARAVGAD